MQQSLDPFIAIWMILFILASWVFHVISAHLQCGCGRPALVPSLAGQRVTGSVPWGGIGRHLAGVGHEPHVHVVMLRKALDLGQHLTDVLCFAHEAGPLVIQLVVRINHQTSDAKPAMGQRDACSVCRCVSRYDTKPDLKPTKTLPVPSPTHIHQVLIDLVKLWNCDRFAMTKVMHDWGARFQPRLASKSISVNHKTLRRSSHTYNGSSCKHCYSCRMYLRMNQIALDAETNMYVFQLEYIKLGYVWEATKAAAHRSTAARARSSTHSMEGSSSSWHRIRWKQSSSHSMPRFTCTPAEKFKSGLPPHERQQVVRAVGTLAMVVL